MITFDSVAAMAASSQVAGDFVSTGGYYEDGGSGAGRYFVKTAIQAASDGDVIDGVTNFPLANGNVAILQGDLILSSQSGSASGNAGVIGSLNVGAMPTSSAGLVTGDLWNDAGTVKII